MRRPCAFQFAVFVCFLFIATSRLSAQESPAKGVSAGRENFEDSEEGGFQLERQEWFYGQRAYPHKRVPAGAHRRALLQLEQKRAAEAKARQLHGAQSQTATTWTSSTWASIGPQPIDTPFGDSVVAGRVTAIVVDPTNTSTVYAAGAQGGVWKTTNGGSSWTPLTDTLPSLAVGSLALDPSNSSTIYVGTGEGNFSGDSYYGAGILKSTDGGNTWTQYCGPFCGPLGQDGYYGGGARIGALAVDPSNTQNLLAAVELANADGIYRSTDGGKSWTQVISGNPGTAVLFDPVSAGVAYAAIGNSFGGGTESVYKSLNSGQTWAPMNGTGSNVISLTNAGRIVLALAASAPGTLYASLANVSTGDLLAFYKTTDGGANWTQLTATPNYCTPQCWYDDVVAVQPTNPNVIFAGGAFNTTLVRSLDGGNTWATIQAAQHNTSVHADMHAITFSPDGNTLYLGNDGGVNVTTQVTASNPPFSPLNTTLSVTQVYPGLSINPGNVANAIAGTQDNGTVLYTGSATWNEVTCGDGGYTAIDTTTPTTIYATCENIAIEKSTTGGGSGSWRGAQSGVNRTDRVDFIPPLVMDPSQTTALYFGTYRVYQTTNGATNWTAISPDLTDGSGHWAVITTIAVAPTDSNTVYAGTGDGNLQVTTNAGSGTAATWANHNTGLPPRVLTYLAVDPTVSTTAYVTFSGFTGFGDSLGHVFKTVNGGTSWTDISSDLPNTPVNCIVVDPDSPSTLFVGTDVGVLYTTNSGSSWTSLVDGLPRVAVLSLSLHEATRTLRAGTHGRGVWDIPVPSGSPAPSLASIAPTSKVAGSASFKLTLKGSNFVSGAVVQWNGSDRATKFVKSTQVTATINAADVATPGVFPVTATNPGSAASNALSFTVKNPKPTLASLSPSSATHGGPGFTLTVTGTNFLPASVVKWKGSARTTTYVSSTQLTAQINAKDIAKAGTAAVVVSNPKPGGGNSKPLTFTIN